MCKNKEKCKKCKKQKEQAKIRKARTEKEIWVYINKEKKKKKNNENRIKTETWRNHFKNLLKGADERIVGEGREQIVAEEDISDLLNEEIEKQIRRLRKRKATGGDNVQNKAWLFSKGRNTRKKLKEVIRKVWTRKGFPDDWRKAVITRRGVTQEGEHRGPRKLQRD